MKNYYWQNENSISIFVRKNNFFPKYYYALTYATQKKMQ